MATAATLSSFAATAPSAFAAGSQLRQPTSCRRLSSSFTGSQLAPVLSRASPAKQLEAQRHSRKSASVRAFIGGPGCGPRGGRYGGRGFYGRGSFPCGPQGVVVVPVPGMGTGMWPGYSPPDPEQFEQYQQRQKEAYEARRAVYEAQRAAWEVEAQKRRELREKQAAFFRKQQEELCREQQKWTQEYRDKGHQAGSTASVEAPPAPEQATQTETKEETKIEPEAPPRFPQSDTPVVHLRNEANGAEITLVGTAHISEASVEDVCNIIRSEKPDAVMVELDRKRYNRLVAASPEQQFLEEMMRLFVGAGMGPVGRLIGVGLMGFYRMLAYRGLQPGREFKVAIEEAKRVGAKVVLGDQDIDETLRNLEASMSPRDVQAFFTQPMPDDILKEIARDGPVGMGPGSFGPWGPLAGGRDTQAWVEKLKDRKIVRKLNSYMRRHAPALEKVMLQQRNAKMARALRHLEGKVVAVVGMAHLDGIEQLWQEQNDKVRQDRQAEVVEAEASAPVDVVDPAQNEVQLHLEDADVIDGVKEDTETAASTSSEAAVEEAAPTAASDDVQPSTEGERASAADEPGSTSEETRGSPNDEGKQDAPRANGEAVDQ